MFWKIKTIIYKPSDRFGLKKCNDFYIIKLLKKDTKDKNDISNSFNELIDKIEKYYSDMALKNLEYEKRKLIFRANNYGNTDIMGHIGIVAALCMTVVSTLISVIAGKNPDTIEILLSYLLRCFIFITMVLIITFIINTKLTSKHAKSFDIMCLDIVEEIIKGKKNKINKLEKSRLELSVTLENERKAKRTIIKVISKIVKALK